MAMKNIFYILIFLICSQVNLFAEWVSVGASVDNKDFYYKKEINIKNGNLLVWTMISSPNQSYVIDDLIDNKPVRSAQIKKEINCIEKKYKDLSYVFYGSKMGKDLLSQDSTSGNWEYAPPGSINEAIVDLVCSVKKRKSR